MQQKLKDKIEVLILEEKIELAKGYHEKLEALYNLSTILPVKPDEIMQVLSTSKQLIVDMTTEAIKLK